MAKKLTLDEMYQQGLTNAENDAIIAEARKVTPWMVPFLTGEHAATFLQWAKDAKAGKAPTQTQISQATYSWPETQDWSANQLTMYNLSISNPET